MSRNVWKKLAIKVAAVGMVFAVGMSEKVYAAEEETIYEQMPVEKTISEVAEEGGVELPIAVYGSGDQSGYVDGTNKKVSWTYDAATKTVTITGSSKRKPEFWSQGPGFPRDTEQIVFIDCVLSGSMTSFFKDASNVKNIDVSGLTMQDITNTTLMFYGCTSLESIDLSNLDTSNVTSMTDMFRGCSSLNGLDVSHFDTSNVTNMCGMFYECGSLTSLDVSKFDTSKVTDMSIMFAGCSSVSSLDVSKFDTSNVEDMGGMFRDCSSISTLDVSNFDTSKAENMSGMFEDCSNISSLDVSNFDTSNATGIAAMFDGCSNLTSLDVSNFDTSKAFSMTYMFRGCGSLTNLDVSNFNTSKVSGMENMFEGCSSLTCLDVSNFDTSKVSGMPGMFNGCSSLTSLDVSNFDTSKVLFMENMFRGCSGLTSLDVSNFNTAKATHMENMFEGCSGLTSLNVSNFDTSKVFYMQNMFKDCRSLTSLDTSNFDFSSLIYERSTDDGMKPFDPVEKMLEECNCLESFTTPSVMGRAQIQLPGIFTDGTTKMRSVNADYVNTLLKKIMVVNAFEDVVIDQWYVPYIQYVYDKGLMNGTSETTFEPDMTLTREMFAVILYSMAGKPEVMIDNPFSDVLEDKWYTEAVLWAYNEGIVSGIGGNKYGVESEITREQLALMMYGYAKKCGKNSNIKEGVMDGFADAGKVSDWASDAIQWAISQGVMNGKPGEGGVMNLEPDGKATRAECATMVMRLAQLQ